MQQKLALLDSINPILRDELKTRHGIELPQLTAESVKNIDSYKLLFYTSTALNSIDDTRASFAALVIRRKAKADPVEILHSDKENDKILKSYFNLYVNYLNLKIHEEFERYVENLFRGKVTTMLTNILILSKRAHYYGAVADSRILTNTSDLVYDTVIQLNDKFPNYKPVWLYSYLHSTIISTSEDLAESYKRLFERVSHDSLTSFYLLLFNPRVKYRDFKEIFYTIENPHKVHIDNFISVLEAFFTGNLAIKSYEEKIELPELCQDVKLLLQHMRDIGKDEFYSRCKYINRRANSSIEQERKQLKNRLYTASLDELDKYLDNPFLNEIQKNLLMHSKALDTSALKMLSLAITNIPSLSPEFLKLALDNSTEQTEFAEVFSTIDSIKNLRVRSQLYNLFIELSHDVESICNAIAGQESRAEMLRSIKAVLERQTLTVPERAKLISLLQDRKTVLDFISTLQWDQEDIYLTVKELELEKHYIKKNFSTVTENIVAFSQDSVVDILFHLFKEDQYSRQILELLRVYEWNDGAGIILSEVLYRLIFDKKDPGDIYSFYSNIAENLSAHDMLDCASYLLDQMTSNAGIDSESDDLLEEILSAYPKYDLLIYRIAAYIGIVNITWSNGARKGMIKSVIAKFKTRKSLRELACVLDVYNNIKVNDENSVCLSIKCAKKYQETVPFCDQNQYPEFKPYVMHGRALLSLTLNIMALMLNERLNKRYTEIISELDSYVSPSDIWSLNANDISLAGKAIEESVRCLVKVCIKDTKNSKRKEILDRIFPFVLQIYSYMVSEIASQQELIEDNLDVGLYHAIGNLKYYERLVSTYVAHYNTSSRQLSELYYDKKSMYIDIHLIALEKNPESSKTLHSSIVKALVGMEHANSNTAELFFSSRLEKMLEILAIFRTNLKSISENDTYNTTSKLADDALYSIVSAILKQKNTQLIRSIATLLANNTDYLVVIRDRDRSIIDRLGRATDEVALHDDYFSSALKHISSDIGSSTSSITNMAASSSLSTAATSSRRNRRKKGARISR